MKKVLVFWSKDDNERTVSEFEFLDQAVRFVVEGKARLGLVLRYIERDGKAVTQTEIDAIKAEIHREHAEQRRTRGARRAFFLEPLPGQGTGRFLLNVLPDGSPSSDWLETWYRDQYGDRLHIEIRP